MKTAFFIPTLVFALLLAACAAPIRSDVTRFNEITRPRGESFIIIAKNPGREGSLELQTYAAEVSRHLVAEGYRPAGEGEPDLIVTVDFGISGPLEEGYESRPAPYFGFTYFGHRYPYGNPYGYPYYDPYGPYYGPDYGYAGLNSFQRWRYSYLYDTSDYKRIVYERAFEMAIKKNKGGFVFEGRAVSVGRSRDLPKVMPYLIEALFTDFPGQNGSTVRVTIKPEG